MAHLFAKWIILLTLKMHEHETEQPKCAEFLQSFMPTADYSWSLQSFFSCLSLSFSSHSIMMIFLSNRCLLHVICFERYLVYIHTCIDVLVYGHDFLVLFFQNNFFFSMLHYCECCALFIGRSGDLLILFVNYSHVHNHARYFAIK